MLTALLLLLWTVVAASSDPHLAAAQRPPRMRGVSWEAGRPIEPGHLAPLLELGADWIAQTPFGFCRAADDTVLVVAPERVHWGESDAGLVQTAAWARDLGIRTLLKPHLWMRGGWVGEIRMQSESDWRAWFAAYERFIVHYARLAQANGFEAFAIGTELAGTTARTQDWRRIIAAVRAVYHGPITYCANWDDEVEAIAFWDALDFIGVQAYYPLGNDPRPSPGALRRAWRPVVARLERLAARTGKTIVFTEVGYRSAAGATHRPWSWESSESTDFELQRAAYAALFATWWEVPWFGGAFVWKWHPRQLAARDPRRERDFTPQGKPALAVIRAYYREDDRRWPARPATGLTERSHTGR
jgi:hypothetical protein